MLSRALYRKCQLSLFDTSKYTCLCLTREFKTKPVQSSRGAVKQNVVYAEQKVIEKIVKVNDLKTVIRPYVQLMRLDKPIGIYLLYWPCTWSISLGTIMTGAPIEDSLRLLALFGTGAVLMRGAGCTINDMWDKDIDSQVERTKSRPLVDGSISKKQAVTFLAAQLSASLAILMQLNWYSVFLGASSMALVISYPLAKRLTSYPQLVLGATFNWGALLGYSAVSGAMDWVVGPLYMGAVCWTLIYDTIYAHQDKIDDARIGIKSTALTFGKNTKTALYLTTGIFTTMFTSTGLAAGMNWPYYLAVAGATGHAVNQIYTLNVDNPEDCARKFKSNTWIGLLLFLGILLGGYDRYLSNVQIKQSKNNCEEAS